MTHFIYDDYTTLEIKFINSIQVPLICLQSVALCTKGNKIWSESQEWISITRETKIQFSAELCVFQSAEEIRYPVGWHIMFSSLVYKNNYKTKKKTEVRTLHAKEMYFLLYLLCMLLNEWR